MTSLVFDTSDALPVPDGAGAPAASAAEDGVGRIPSVTIHAYSETPATSAALAEVGSHRRMARAKLTSRPGGIAAAISDYREAVTPNLILLESRAAREVLVADLEALAAVCDQATKVVVVGGANDIELYRELMRHGVSEYLPAPVDAGAMVAAIARVFGDPETKKLGRIYAFIGAKGGVGSSMMSHNVAWTLGRHSGGDSGGPRPAFRHGLAELRSGAGQRHRRGGSRYRSP